MFLWTSEISLGPIGGLIVLDLNNNSNGLKILQEFAENVFLIVATISLHRSSDLEI